jgi:hypothetical protein
MSVRWNILWIVLIAALVLLAGAAPAAEQGEKKSGTVIGAVTNRGNNFIEVKADGEEKARQYFPHLPPKGEKTEPATLELMKKIEVGTRVKLDWLFEERFRVLKIEVLKKDDKK